MQPLLLILVFMTGEMFSIIERVLVTLIIILTFELTHGRGHRLALVKVSLETTVHAHVDLVHLLTVATDCVDQWTIELEILGTDFH